MKKCTVFLKKIDYPEFDAAIPVIYPSVCEIEERIEKCRNAMQRRGLTHLVVYGDREHFGNLMYLAHFDPRFEEALLVINLTDTPLILVGNECEGHLKVSPLYNAGKLRYERYQPFSLVNQPRDSSRSLEDILTGENINSSSKVGCIGWKFFSKEEFPDYEVQIDIPSFITDTLRRSCGYENVINATDILISPQYGLKTCLSPFEIAHFEWVNTMASDGVKKLLQNFRADVTDFELVKEYQYTGYPLACHIGIKSSGNQHIGLSSPVGAKITRGEPISTGISYWGSNICRAGWVVENEEELPESAKGYVQNFAAPYFYACCQWYANMKIGAQGKIFRELIDELLPFQDFAVYLNPGHLIHFEEWISSPIYKNSIDTIKSGMYIQVDIIPRSKKYFSSRMEDGIIIADTDLRAKLKEKYPETYNRCMARRKFMIEVLGIDLPEEVLPLSNIPAIVPPFFLNHTTVLSLIP